MPDEFYSTKVNVTGWDIDVYAIRIQDVSSSEINLQVWMNKNISTTFVAQQTYFNSTKFDSNIKVCSYSNYSIIELGNFTDVIEVEIRCTAVDYKADTKIYISFVLHTSYFWFGSGQIPLIDDLLAIVPIFVVLFVIPLFLYAIYKKVGFSIGLLLSTAIALFTSMISVIDSILLFICEFTIIYLMIKKEKGVD